MPQLPRLDRLSALLEGIAPQFFVRHAGRLSEVKFYESAEAAFLRLHLITGGIANLTLAGEREQCLSAPAIAVTRGDTAYTLSLADGGTDAPVAMCVEVHFGGPVSAILLEAFAVPLMLSLEEADPEMDLVIRLIASEVSQPRCGQPALLSRAGDILFIGLLRHLVAQPRTAFGILNGLSDTRIARALVAIHSAPQFPWTLETLALEAGMSRTAFAVLFRDTMNCPPGGYLAQVRLAIARKAVTNGYRLKHAAKEAGYASTTALSRALARQSISN
ncbi:AraC family transcriptional regulator [Noviherbaspirillum sp. Root189]|uniref:AraC family transcriptional regulator n=1 Tax=Noviherbaspirillum sp. Root189 TaxID=1736487 RepID=UPI000710C1AF|nr:AraC family transcriptional regulator [Noviherbaspirillum sp. Root189]KRB69316.1 AraC family transcriptional regulator [Noviherbaspirillum sp. Root189]